MILVSNLLDEDARKALLETLQKPCANCGDLQHARAAFMFEGDLETLCRNCIEKEVPEQVASHPDYFAGALCSEGTVPALIFSLELRRAHVAGKVPLRFRHLFDPKHWMHA